MKYAIIATLLGSLAIASGAQAKGCITGAIVGGVAGHFAGHHGVLGAVGGCELGRQRAKAAELKKKQEADRMKALNANNPGASRSPSPAVPPTAAAAK